MVSTIDTNTINAIKKSIRILSGIKLAFKTVFFCYASIFIILAFIIISSPPAISSDTPLWQYIFSLSFSLYFLPFGLSLSLGDQTISLMPLFLTFLFIFFSYICAKRVKKIDVITLVTSFIIQSAISIIISILSKTISQESVIKILLLPSLILFSGQAAVYLRARAEIIQTAKYSRKFKVILNFARLSIKISVVTLAFIGIFSCLVFILWTILSFREISAVYSLLNISAFGAVGLIFIQIVFLPNLIFLIPAWFTHMGVSFQYTIPFSLWETNQTLAPTVPFLAIYPTNNSMHFIFLAVLIAFLSIAVWGAWAIIKMTKKNNYRFNFIKEKKNVLKIERFNFGNTLAQLYTPELANRIFAVFICCLISSILNFCFLASFFFLSSGVVGKSSFKHLGVDGLWQSGEIALVFFGVEFLSLIVWAFYMIIKGRIAKKQLKR
ncbi:MAG: DUF6350 family protein [Bifidobacteriaceae bacterium]|jgi:hypothetical protein|nr:DUF6350 family protein [Bifidobacteriaceae bacterium]